MLRWINNDEEDAEDISYDSLGIDFVLGTLLNIFPTSYHLIFLRRRKVGMIIIPDCI